jgi:hypothetical protein
VEVAKGNISKIIDNAKFEKVKENTLRVTFDLLSPKESLRKVGVMTIGYEWSNSFNFWIPNYLDMLNYTIEQNQSQQTNNENQSQPTSSDNQQNNNQGSPGFEAILLLPAILVVLLILRNKKNL